MGWKPWICGASTIPESPRNIPTITAPKPIALPKPPHEAVTASPSPSRTSIVINPVTIEHVQHDQRRNSSSSTFNFASQNQVVPSPTASSVSSTPSTPSVPLETAKPSRSSFSRFDAVAPMAPTVDYFKRRNQALNRNRNSSGSSKNSPVIASTTVYTPIHSNSSSVCNLEPTLDPDSDDDLSRKSQTVSRQTESTHNPITFNYI